MKRLTFLLALIALSNFATGQKLLTINTRNSCSYYGEAINEKIYGFQSSEEAVEIITRITDAVGLKPNFEIKAASVPNALATIADSKRLILYSENFITSIKNATGTDWAGISVLAHEIGHHLNGHTLNEEGSRPEIELEADEFSGFMLAKMGASLEEAQAAFKTVKNSSGSSTHPPKNARIEAVAVGWKKGKKLPKEEKVLQCSYCLGTGWKKEKVNCGNCVRGEITTTNACEECGGRRKVDKTCYRCDKNGKVTCSTCNGDKKIDGPIYVLSGQSVDFNNCPYCNANGKTECSNCQGTKKYKVQCDVCNGKGKITGIITCHACDGLGELSSLVRCSHK